MYLEYIIFKIIYQSCFLSLSKYRDSYNFNDEDIVLFWITQKLLDCLISVTVKLFLAFQWKIFSLKGRLYTISFSFQNYIMLTLSLNMYWIYNFKIFVWVCTLILRCFIRSTVTSTIMHVNIYYFDMDENKYKHILIVSYFRIQLKFAYHNKISDLAVKIHRRSFCHCI